MELKEYTVGQIVCSPSAEETKFDLTDGGALLLIKFNRPTSNEKRDIKSGVAQFKLAVRDGVLFFLCRFGTSNWMDIPYHRDLSEYTLFRPMTGEGLLLHIMLIDASTGCLVVQRVIGLSTAFSSALVDAAAQQRPLGSREAYYKKVAQLHIRYSTNELVESAFAEN